MHPIDTSGKRQRSLDDSGRSRSRDRTSRSSTDDVHSLCSQLSNMAPRSLSVARSVSSSNSSRLLKSYKEPALLPEKPAGYSSIRLVKTQTVVEFVNRGELPTFRKQSNRSTNNPWRRYGALRKLCETGGFAPNNASKKDRKKREQLVFVKQNVKLPPAPTTAQMTLNKVRDPGIYEKRLALSVPKNAPVDVAAQKLAEQVKTFILNYGVELMEDDSAASTNSK